MPPDKSTPSIHATCSRSRGPIRPVPQPKSTHRPTPQPLPLPPFLPLLPADEDDPRRAYSDASSSLRMQINKMRNPYCAFLCNYKKVKCSDHRHEYEARMSTHTHTIPSWPPPAAACAKIWARWQAGAYGTQAVLLNIPTYTIPIPGIPLAAHLSASGVRYCSLLIRWSSKWSAYWSNRSAIICGGAAAMPATSPVIAAIQNLAAA